MLETVLRNQCGLDPARPVLAGISGGPDSLCLLGILQEAGYRVIVAHFNHQLRPEAGQEAVSVSTLAQRLGLLFVTDGADVGSYAEEKSLSLEEAARTLRYRFLFAAARTHTAQAVAVGHTADDQVETVLMHFLRGAGLAGLKGMEYRTILPVFDAQIALVRPLLSLRRSQTEAYCREHDLQPQLDASNADTAYFRNRLRHELIPELETYNPRLKESLLRSAQTLQGDYAALHEVLEPIWKEVVVEKDKDWVAFDRDGLAKLSPGMRRNLLRQAGESLRPEDRDFGFNTLERAAAFVETPAGRQVDFANGLYLFAEQGKIILAAYQADLPFQQWPQVGQEIVIRNSLFVYKDQSLVSSNQDSGTGEQRAENREQLVELGNGWVLKVEERLREGDGWRQEAGAWSAWLDADRIPAEELVIRPRQPGDTFAPLGMGGQTTKLQDYFINHKIPQRARAHWPLICAGDQVIWVVGYQIAHPFRITEETRHILHLEIKKHPQP
jgi:tRNA(Ile)-lysidine synthase